MTTLELLLEAQTAIENARRAVRNSRAESLELSVAKLRVDEAVDAFRTQ